MMRYGYVSKPWYPLVNLKMLVNVHPPKDGIITGIDPWPYISMAITWDEMGGSDCFWQRFQGVLNVLVDMHVWDPGHLPLFEQMISGFLNWGIPKLLSTSHYQRIQYHSMGKTLFWGTPNFQKFIYLPKESTHYQQQVVF